MSSLKDSVDKIVTTYFAVITRRPFVYKDTAYFPQDVRVSPGLFRGYTCPAGCGGCCSRFSLDYLPSEPRPNGSSRLQPRVIEFNKKEYKIWSDPQTDHADHHCVNLNKEGDGPQTFDPDLDPGRCQIHGKHPFTCDFELIRFSQTTKKSSPNYINQRLYGRGWQMLRIDGERGAMCEMITGDDSWKKDTLRRLGRLKDWAEYFEVDHCLNEVIGWVYQGPHDEPLIINNRR